MISLPIDPYLPDIVKLWSSEKRIIISASAGSGKTTRIPWALANNTNKRIVILVPRKIAARMAAMRIAEENQLTLGKEIGYAYRDDVRFDQSSKVIFFTEGTFIRFLNDDHFFNSIDTIIFDEFHERHVETDLCLALVRHKLQQYPELKYILMSATIDTEMVNLLDAKSIEIHSQFYQVKVHYLPNTPSILNQELSLKIKNTMRNLPSKGDVLVFLPGMREILKAKDLLGEEFGKTYILHSEIDKDEQEKILLPSTGRKIILATNIAESSVTIPGIKYIIDSGLEKVSEYNPWTGIKTLNDRPITQASAIQRMYRAGRTQDGECYRLYSEFDFSQREKYTVPEILTAELNEVYLLSAHYSHQLDWLTRPSEDKWKKAKELNHLLGLIRDDQLTEIGEFALKGQLNIRLAAILWSANQLRTQDKEKLLLYICKYISQEDPKYLRRRLQKYLKENTNKTMEDMAIYILRGMVDQVVKFRSSQNDFIHYSGSILKRSHALIQPENNGLYIATSINHRAQIEELLDIQEEWLIDLEPYPLLESQEVIWNDYKIHSSFKVNLGSINIEEQITNKSWDSLTKNEQEIFLNKNRQKYLNLFSHFTDSHFYKRLQFYCRIKEIELPPTPSFKDFMEYTFGDHDRSADFFKYSFENVLSISMDLEVPEYITLHNKKFPINYENEASIQGYIQDFYGLNKSPTIMHNLPLTLILLGPHKRPIQYTKDLIGFWSRTYKDMLKELKREYPHHHWSDNPLNAPPVLLKRHL